MRTVQSSFTRANGGVANTRLAEPAEVACAIALSFRPIVCIQSASIPPSGAGVCRIVRTCRPETWACVANFHRSVFRALSAPLRSDFAICSSRRSTPARAPYRPIFEGFGDVDRPQCPVLLSSRTREAFIGRPPLVKSAALAMAMVLALLIRGELVEASGLAVVLRQTTTPIRIEIREIVLPACVPLACGKLEQTCGLTVVLRQAATALRIEISEIVLPACVFLICGKPVQTCCLTIILRQAATALRIEIPEIGLAASEPLIGRELVEPKGLTVVLREAPATLLVEQTEIGLPPWVSLISSQLVEARGLAIVLGDPAAALLVEAPEIGLPSCVSLIRRELVEAGRLAVVSRQAAPAV
jgi:hypothetical protein